MRSSSGPLDSSWPSAEQSAVWRSFPTRSPMEQSAASLDRLARIRPSDRAPATSSSREPADSRVPSVRRPGAPPNTCSRHPWATRNPARRLPGRSRECTPSRPCGQRVGLVRQHRAHEPLAREHGLASQRKQVRPLDLYERSLVYLRLCEREVTAEAPEADGVEPGPQCEDTQERPARK